MRAPPGTPDSSVPTLLSVFCLAICMQPFAGKAGLGGVAQDSVPRVRMLWWGWGLRQLISHWAGREGPV